MQSMLWQLHILIVLKISMQINSVHSESSHPNINFKWSRKHHSNAHKHLIDEMSPDQLSRFHEEYNDNKIPLRHTKFAKLDQIMCSRMGNCSASPAKKDVSSKDIDTTTVLQKNREPELELKLRNIRKSRPRRLDIDNEAPVIEDLSDFAAGQANRSHFQENERRKSNTDELSSVSKHKMEVGSNITALNIRFQQIYKTSPPVSSSMARLVDIHINQAVEETRCKIPTPIIVRVSEKYTHPHKFYVPPCIKLFQCTESSGCCTEPKRCMPHRTENVTLLFKVHTDVKGVGEVVTVEQLTFQNDTECHCKHVPISNPVTEENNWENLETEANDESKFECMCPAPYSKRILNNGKCTCDCFYNDKPCLIHKTGGSFMKSHEIKCIRAGKCTKPVCEYGDYSVESGRCPKLPRSKTTKLY